MHKIKWGIIGSGNIAKAFAHSIKYCQNSELTSVFGRNSEMVDQFSTKFGIAAFTDLDEFISSNNIDAVYIATPHNPSLIHISEPTRPY